MSSLLILLYVFTQIRPQIMAIYGYRVKYFSPDEWYACGVFESGAIATDCLSLCRALYPHWKRFWRPRLMKGGGVGGLCKAFSHSRVRVCVETYGGQSA